MTAATGAAAGPARHRRPVSRSWRVLLLFPAGLALLVGIGTGLRRFGVPFGFGPLNAHGPLMVLGFLGTLIALERAVALGSRWAYLATAASGLGTLGIIAGLPVEISATLLVIGGLGVVAIYGRTLQLQPTVHLAVMAIGALAWPLAAALWAVGWTPPQLVPLLAGFLVPTIVGERLELSRMRQPPAAAQRWLLMAIAIFVLAVALSLWWVTAAWILAGTGLTAQALWLARHDLARSTIRLAGLPRFAAVCLLSGYVWLGFGGLLWVWHAVAPGAFTYDAAVHAIFLGFIMSMVFGHAPIILPAVLRVTLPHRPIQYLPVVLLHATLVLRVAGDLTGSRLLRESGGVGNAVALLAFVLVTVASSVTRR